MVAIPYVLFSTRAPIFFAGVMSIEYRWMMFSLRGRITDSVDGGVIYWMAAAPAEHNSSFSGSGLPYANRQQAFDGTPNTGTAHLDANNEFTVQLHHPGSFYDKAGTRLVPPTLFVRYFSNGQPKQTSLQLSDSIPYRSLTYPKGPQTRARSDPSFYDNAWGLPVRSQEEILLDSAYPSADSMHANFWGLKPAV